MLRNAQKTVREHKPKREHHHSMKHMKKGRRKENHKSSDRFDLGISF
jgi:hypothetical protein